MKKEHKTIIDSIAKYLEQYPDLRFGQAIFNLGINEFQKTTDSKYPNYTLRDIHNDSDKEIINRIDKQLEWFDLQRKVNNGLNDVGGVDGMTVNERLFATGLMDTFDRYKKINKDYAHFILKSLKVDSESIKRILK